MRAQLGLRSSAAAGRTVGVTKPGEVVVEVVATAV
jgi:hypothetical protein